MIRLHWWAMLAVVSLYPCRTWNLINGRSAFIKNIKQSKLPFNLLGGEEIVDAFMIQTCVLCTPDRCTHCQVVTRRGQIRGRDERQSEHLRAGDSHCDGNGRKPQKDRFCQFFKRELADHDISKSQILTTVLTQSKCHIFRGRITQTQH